MKILFFNEEKKEYESIWSIKQKDDLYKIDNIPFYVKNIALNDIVSAYFENDFFYFKELIQESGHSTIQIIFFESEVIESIVQDLKQMGCQLEGSDLPRYYSMDVPFQLDYSNISKYLLEKEEADLLSFREA
jgi:hypothetical protein